MRKSNLKVFRDIQVDESNILSWKGLIVPVSSRDACVPETGYCKRMVSSPLIMITDIIIIYE